VAAAALLAGGLVSIVMARQSQTALREQIVATNLAAADLTAEFAWHYMQAAQKSLEFFSRSQHVLEAVRGGYFKQATSDLQEFLKANTSLAICSLFDSAGHLKASGSANPSLASGFAGDREWFQQAVTTRKPYLGVPMISRGSKQPVLPYVIPIFDRNQELQAVLLGGISITALSDAITKFQSGPGVRVSIADSRRGGMILAHRDPERVLQPVSRRNEAGVRMSRRERGAMETTDTDGNRVLAAFAPVPNLPWGVLIMQPNENAFAPVRASLNKSQFWTSILLLITATVAGWLALRVTRPLVHLRQATTALAEGRRTAPINMTRQDELGDLGRAFDHMAAALAERTGQLETANEDLAEQNRRIQQADRLKSEFLANMSHELRTPLNAIIGFAEIMHDGKVGPMSSQHKEYLGDVLTSARHLLQLINDILDLSKVEAGKMEFRPTRVNLALVVQEARAIVRAMAAKKRINLRSEIDPSLCDIETDPRSLKQILYNYLSNALKFTPEGGVVTVRAKPEALEQFRIEVEDNGIGIPAEDQQRLFVEFQQLDASTGKKYSGTGLGLALTKKIVEAQGGRVGVNSAPGAGSVFYAVLPRCCRSANEITETAKTRVDPANRRPLVLVVEAGAQGHVRIAERLRNAGFAIEAAATGLEAVARCHHTRFDAIALDGALPDMTGRDALKRMRERGLNQQTPVIMVTPERGQEAVAGFAVHDIPIQPTSQNGLDDGQSRELIDELKRILDQTAAAASLECGEASALGNT
jgi:signal transduction histidine kinase